MATRIHAPDFPPGATWLGVRSASSLASLRGQVVVLHFWTSC